MESKMPMSQADIAKEYREAKNKKQQIKILADENLCKTGDIVRVLLAAGTPKSRRSSRKRSKSTLDTFRAAPIKSWKRSIA